MTVRCLRVDGRPAYGGSDGRRPEGAHAPAQVRGQNLLELYERPDRRLVDPCHRRACGCAEAYRDSDRLVVVEKQRGHRGPGTKPVTAGRTGQRLDRVAQPPQTLDVAPDRPPRYLEAIRQFAARPVAAGLKEREQLQEAA